ncbi:MAG TPA: hypothetical protein VGM73_17890 [Candidatus Didemnitutus sp.]
MTDSAPNQPTTIADRLMRVAFCVLLGILIVTVPNKPSDGLDASWRMSLGYFFQHGLQFGRDVVFTYGPLGFLMGKTYSGLQFGSFLVWQLVQAVVYSIVIFRQGLRLVGYPRLFYFLFFFTLGVSYEDELQQIIVALIGFEFIRAAGTEGRTHAAFHASFLAVLSLLKFTNLMLAGVFVAAILVQGLLLRRRTPALWFAGWFVGAFLAGWVLCRQNPLNLPAYFVNSWDVSQGYQEAMGLPPPSGALWKGVLVLCLLVAYAACYLMTKPDRIRAGCTVAGLAAFVYLNWKHGFVRADGHMIGFFYCALTVIVAFPALLGDTGPWLSARRWLLAVTGMIALLGVHTALPWLLRGFLGNLQEKFFTNLQMVCAWPEFREAYDKSLELQVKDAALPEMRKTIGQSTVDVFGYEQGVALFNGFNYTPRPVFQSYSAYTPRLSHLNYEFYASDRAPEYVLFKLHTIDGRFSTFDDSQVLALLVQRYEYVQGEGTYHLWHRKPGPFDPRQAEPKPIRTEIAPMGKPVKLADLADRPLWVEVDAHPSLLGRLRSFFYKPAVAQLQIRDSNGKMAAYRMPLPEGRAGFIINPIVEDVVSYMRFAGAAADRRVDSIALICAAQDRDCFADNVIFAVSALPPSTAGREFFRQVERVRFHLFQSTPVSFQAAVPPTEEAIDGRPVMVLHAPSEMTFDVPAGAHEIAGTFGYMPGAYSNGGNTDGAEFFVEAEVNGQRRILFDRFLDPVHTAADRGLQSFRAALPVPAASRLYLRVSAGARNNNSWDWTAWTGIDIR